MDVEDKMHIVPDVNPALLRNFSDWIPPMPRTCISIANKLKSDDTPQTFKYTKIFQMFFLLKAADTHTASDPQRYEHGSNRLTLRLLIF